jgi:hypothetical protein
VTPELDPFTGKPIARSQAERVIGKFGGVAGLVKALKRLDESKHRDPSNVYRWMYPKTKGGTGGLVPTAALADVYEAARLEGILLSAEDVYPGRR